MSTAELSPRHLRWASRAGASYLFTRVVKEFPNSSAGFDLRFNVECGRLTADSTPENFVFLGGGFTGALWNGDLEGALGVADKENRKILMERFGVGRF